MVSFLKAYIKIEKQARMMDGQDSDRKKVGLRNAKPFRNVKSSSHRIWPISPIYKLSSKVNKIIIKYYCAAEKYYWIAMKYCCVAGKMLQWSRKNATICRAN